MLRALRTSHSREEKGKRRRGEGGKRNGAEHSKHLRRLGAVKGENKSSPHQHTLTKRPALRASRAQWAPQKITCCARVFKSPPNSRILKKPTLATLSYLTEPQPSWQLRVSSTLPLLPVLLCLPVSPHPPPCPLDVALPLPALLRLVLKTWSFEQHQLPLHSKSLCG